MTDIEELNENNIEKFWDYVLRDVPLYFFFILDLKQYPEECRFFLALENGSIVGLCLIWKNHIAHVRGHNSDVVRSLFETIPKDIPVKEINFEYKYTELLSELVPNPKHEIFLHRMKLNKEKMIPRFILDNQYLQRVLTESDAPIIAKLLAKADPKFWGDVNPNDFTFDESQIYVGLFDKKKLISYTLTWMDEEAAIIATAATHPKYQNKGLASYLVNESIHTMMDHTEIAIIHVMTENKPALRVYSKVGYEVYATFVMVEL
ncbi:MAG: GNAT family N-acetyltransferase [Candidatus Heimdallarchaeota archaeon]|nr:GNAT family N-acetyltransferase [Candidatus Heimdallarchaeota archaeon]